MQDVIQITLPVAALAGAVTVLAQIITMVVGLLKIKWRLDILEARFHALVEDGLSSRVDRNENRLTMMETFCETTHPRGARARRVTER